jgi:hypothetical protein
VRSVNRLVNALIAHPQVIEEMARHEDARFGPLLDVLGDAAGPGSELHGIKDDPQLRKRLESGYLPTVSALDWDDALSLTENRIASNSGWWTVMIPGTSGRVGLTAPQDGSPSGLVALFTGPASSARILVYDPTPSSVNEITGGPHCGPSSLGRCHEGICHDCAAFEVYDEATHTVGIKCMCSHQSER